MSKGVYERTPEHNAANSKAHMGRKTSDKTPKENIRSTVRYTKTTKNPRTLYRINIKEI